MTNPNFSYFLPYFLPPIFLLGFISSYTDLKSHKIKNTHLFVFLLYSISVYSILLIFNKSPIGFTSLLINFLIASAIGIILYSVGLWAAGDSKLFIAYSLLIPGCRYCSLLKFPSLVLFVNITLVGTIGAIIISSKDLFSKPDIYLHKLVSKENFNSLLKSIIIIFSLTWLIMRLFNSIKFLKGPISFLFLYIFYFVLYRIIGRYNQHSKKILTGVILTGIILRLIIQPQFFSSLSYVLNYFLRILKYTIFFQLLRFIFLRKKDKKLKNISESKEESQILPEYTIGLKTQDIYKNSIVAFAPYMFIGALTINSPLILYTTQFLNLLRQ